MLDGRRTWKKIHLVFKNIKYGKILNTFKRCIARKFLNLATDMYAKELYAKDQKRIKEIQKQLLTNKK